MIKMKITPRLAEVGKIKIGMKGEEKTSSGGKKYRQPVKLDHFIVTTTDKGPDQNFLIDTHVMKELGASPTEIPIRLPFDDIDLNFFTQYQFYKGKKCWCRGDGEKADRLYKEDEPTKPIKCDTETCEFFKSGKCKVSGVLSCMLPSSADVGGIYRFRTHGWNSVSGILASLMFFQQNTNGVLQGLPLKLKFLKKHTEDHGSVPVVSIVLDGVILTEMRKLAYEEAVTRKELGVDIKQIELQATEGGFLNDTDTIEDIVEEHYPDNGSGKGTGADELAEKLKGKVEEVQEAEYEESTEPEEKGQSEMDLDSKPDASKSKKKDLI